MPRLSALRVAALARLATDLRFAPRERLVRIIEQAERLAAEVDPESIVDERDLTRALTGYAPDLDDPGVVPGEALLADLSAFVERMSERARLRERDAPGGLSTERLAARWGVSERTVARRRREGLIGRRVRIASGAGERVAIRFMPAVVDAVERRFAIAERPVDATIDRLSEADVARVARLARRLERRDGWTRTRIARRLARRFGRSEETIRRALENRLGPPRRRRTDRLVRAAHERWARGERVAEIARDSGRSASTLRRWISGERRRSVERWVGLDREPGMERSRVDAALDHPAVREGLRPELALRAGEFVAAARAAPATDPEAERALAEAHTALRLSALELAASEREDGLDAAETRLRWAALTRLKLAWLHRRLALRSVETAIGGPLLELSPSAIRALHREAMGALVEGVARHDARGGGSVTASMSVLLTRRLARAPETAAARRALAGGAARALSSHAGLDDWTRRPAAWSEALGTPEGVDPASLDAALWAWVRLRHGLDGRAPRTRAQAAAELGVSKQRAAGLERARRGLRR